MRPCRFRGVLEALVAVGFATGPVPLAAACLRQDGPPTGLPAGGILNRRFSIGQKSYWIPAGADSTVVPVVDTVVEFMPDSLGGVTADFEAWESGSGSLSIASEGVVRRVSVANDWHDGAANAGGLLLHSGIWQQALPVRGPGAWRDSGVVSYAHGVGSATARISREGQATGWVGYAGGRWLRMRATRSVTVGGSSRIERELYGDGVPVELDLTGDLVETFLFEPNSGWVDSVQVGGTLRGRLIYHEPTGRADTVIGSWRVEQLGAWVRQLSLGSEDVAFRGRHDGPGRQRGLVTRVPDGPTDSVSSLRLLRARRRIDSPAVRWPLDAALVALRYYLEPHEAFARQLLSTYRAGDVRVLAELAVECCDSEWGVGELPEAYVRAVAEQFRSLRHERRSQVDRANALENLAAVARGPNPVPRGAAADLAELAATTDDPEARPLLALLAYQADPGRYLSLLTRLADTTRGTYGAVARAYVRGNLGESFWGPHPMGFDTAWVGPSYPGLERSWREHLAYFALHRGAWDPGVDWLGSSRYGATEYGSVARAVRLLLEAEGMDARPAFARRFVTEDDSTGRLVWANYLLSLGDTTPLPWVRRAYRTGAGRPARDAFRLLELHAALTRDTVRDPAEAGAVQELLLGCLTGTALPDSTGAPASACAPVRDDDWMDVALTDHLSPTVLSRWGERFTLISRAAARHGPDRLVLAVGPVTRIEDRYYVTYSVAPASGQLCLCGSGGSLVLQRRDGAWRVMGGGGWIR